MRQLRWPAAAGALWVAGYGLAVVLLAGDPRARQILSDLVYMVPTIVAVVLGVLVCRRTTGTRRAVWLLLTSGSMLGLAGDATWAVQDLLLPGEESTPSLADVFWIVSYLPLPAAIVVAFGRAPALRRARAVLDTSLVTAAVGLVGWRLLIAPQVVAGIDAATATSIAYPWPT